MSVRFLIGRAGSGKTYTCLHEIRAALRTDPLEGPRLIFLVPEQATLQMERALIESPDIPAFHRAEVLSFRRLVYRVEQTAGSDNRPVLSPIGRIMALQNVIASCAGRLRTYRSVHRAPAFARQLAATITELIHADATPASLRAAADHARRTSRPTIVADRLEDLAALLDAWNDYLRTGPAEPAQRLLRTAENLPGCPWIRGARIWVDGFAGFTAQQIVVLVALARLSGEMTCAFLADPRHLPWPPAFSAPQRRTLFAGVERIIAVLYEALTAAGLTVQCHPLGTEDLPTHRFRNDTLRTLEQHVFEPAPSPPAEPPVGIELIEAPSRRHEVETVASRILDLVHDDNAPLRFRDIAVILRDHEPYQDLIAEVFADRGIPCFFDRRYPVTHHPLISLWRALIALATDDFRIRDVTTLLRTSLLPVPDDRLDALENYLLAYGIEGRRRWTSDDWNFLGRLGDEPADRIPAEQVRHLAMINETRRAVLDALAPWIQATADTAPRPARDWARALADTLHHLRVAETLARWSQAADDDGRHLEALEYRQVWNQTTALLDDLVEALGDQEMDIARFGEVLLAGAGELTIGVPPANVDQVLVGTIDRSRHPELRAVFVLGFNDGMFPASPPDPPLLGDEEREALAAAGLRLLPARRDRLDEERTLAYITLTRPSDRLVISWSRADARGRAIYPSPFLPEIQRALPGLTIARLRDPMATRDLPPAIDTLDDLVAALADEFRSRPALADDPSPDLRARWNLLYSILREGCPHYHEFLTDRLGALVYTNSCVLSSDIVAALFPLPLRTSVSQIETWAQCPFRHFAAHALRLRPRDLADVTVLDLGSLYHRMLRLIIDDVRQALATDEELDDQRFDQLLSSVTDRLRAELTQRLAVFDSRHEYLLARAAIDLGRVLRVHREAWRRGRFRPHACELPFGRPEDHLPALELTTPAGHTVHLTGRIDRVDIADLGEALLAAVVDYKRTANKSFDWVGLLEGYALQLLTYLLALREIGPQWLQRSVEPSGAFFCSLLMRTKTDSLDKLADPPEPDLRPRGVFNEDHIRTYDNQTQQGRSPVVRAQWKQSGELGYRNRADHLPPETFRRLLTFAARRIGELCDELLAGNVTPRPYRLRNIMPCTHCEHRSVCRFEPGLDRPRRITPRRRDEVLQEIARILEGNAGDA